MTEFPFDLRIGSSGFGIIGGCGAGIGFLSPLNLEIPLSQVAGSIAASLRTTDSALGHPGLKASFIKHTVMTACLLLTMIPTCCLCTVSWPGTVKMTFLSTHRSEKERNINSGETRSEKSGSQWPGLLSWSWDFCGLWRWCRPLLEAAGC